jgi:hypothetical protein
MTRKRDKKKTGKTPDEVRKNFVRDYQYFFPQKVQDPQKPKTN